jgi:nickel-dependent lactate racemase
MRTKLAYGRSGLWVDLPDSAAVTLIEPNHVSGLNGAAETQALYRALREPIASPALRDLAAAAFVDGQPPQAAVVFSDLTRPVPNDRILPPLLSELAAAGIPDDHITLINGLGTHRQQTEAELRGMLGDTVVSRYRIVQHDGQNKGDLLPVIPNHLGRWVSVNRHYLEANLRILTGFIEPHFFAGFSGGPKAVLPGIADLTAIMENHGADQIAHPKATWGILEGNPIWEEMAAVSQATRPSFLLNVALNKDKEITAIFAGDCAAAHAAGVAFVRQNAMQPVVQPFDVVLTSNSGYPLDLNLYQSVKGMSAAAQVVRAGGDIIIAAECWDGLPQHGQYTRLLRESASPDDLLARIMAPGFHSPDQWQVQIQANIQKKARVHVYADGLSDQELLDAKVIPCRSIEQTLAEILRRSPSATIGVLPEGPQTIPYLVSSVGETKQRSTN